MELIKVVPEQIESLGVNVVLLIFCVIFTVVAFSGVVLFIRFFIKYGFDLCILIPTLLFLWGGCSGACYTYDVAKTIREIRNGEAIQNVYYFSVNDERDKRKVEVDYEIIKDLDEVVKAVKRSK